MWQLERAINYFIELVQILIIARILLSFLIRDPNNNLYRFVFQLTEPIMAPFRNLIYKLGINTGMFDFSPLLTMLALEILAVIIIGLLRTFNYA